MVSKPALHRHPLPPSQLLQLSLSISTKYPAKHHCRSAAALLSPSPSSSPALIYIPGTPSTLLEYSDQPTPFRQRRAFNYLSGVHSDADCSIIYNIATDTLTLYIPPIDPKTVQWTGMPKAPKEYLREFDVDRVVFSDRLRSEIAAWAGGGRSGTIFCLNKHLLPPQTPKTLSSITIDTSSLLPVLDSLRVYKSPHELALLRRAISISLSAHANVSSRVSIPNTPITHESQAEAIFVGTCIAHNARNQAYSPIVAGGANGATLHYTRNDMPLPMKVKGTPLLVDAACEWQCYCADITRTIPIASHTFSEPAQRIYDIVSEMQQVGISLTLPGKRWVESHLAAARVAVRRLLELGVFKNGSVDEIISSGTFRAFFPHGLGHFVGLETHDVEFHDDETVEGVWVADAKMRMMINRTLEKDMVLTVEPGVYFNRFNVGQFMKDPRHARYIDESVIEREGYWDVGGVRIEDIVLVLGEGNEVMSR